MHANKIVEILTNGLKSTFGCKIDNISICECTDVPHTMIAIEFEAYKYFNVRLNFDRGRFGCSIINGKYGVRLESSEKRFEEADLDKFFSDIKTELEVRIPDKYLARYNV